MAFVEDIIFVVGLTGLVYLITDELLLIASASHKHSITKLGSSRIDFSLKNPHKDSNFNDVMQKDSVFNDTQVAKVDDFDQRVCSGVGQSVVFNETQEAKFDDFDQSECSGVEQCKVSDDVQEAKVDDFDQSECSGVEQSCNGEFDNEVGTSRKCRFDEEGYLSGWDKLVEEVVNQNFEFPGLDRGVEKLFDEVSHKDEVMEDEENVGFNVGEEVDKDEEEGWEDDWEGVERSELEKQFGAAVAFVNSKSNADRFSGVESTVKMELYGLHKVAIEGICMKPQPMALKVYSRAKWNAWKQLENMSREEAMEKQAQMRYRAVR
ncbi:ACB domain-containing protein [Heracleum sosnowskyi]|uniref:ACB domain-containing protein n=1 Tax=Heracleum sosnowskyi TaxID=360622 RepID=A0AAD8HAZ3_9APIA|nr:ACB domain-containing protein [Heracleum sosnowskyi]